MLSKLITISLIIVGLINFAPIGGLFSAEILRILYGINVDEPDLLILMRHRALLFGVIGGFIIYSAFRPELQRYAFAAGFITMLGFIIIAWQVGSYNELLKKVLVIDIGALILLIVAATLFLMNRKSR